LLLDEPASGLDPEARIALAELFLRLNAERKMTLVVSSHILAELDQYANDLLILRGGRVVEHRPVTKIGNGRKIIIRCTRGQERIAAIVQPASMCVEQNEVCVQFHGTDEELAQLLQELVQGGVAVTEFFCKKEGVQEQYLETIRT